MQIHLTFERETESSVRCAEDEGDEPERHPGAPVVGTLDLQELAGAQLGTPEQAAAAIEAQGPTGAR